jgi:ribosomal protein S18 acetylase RimI-like enzyme
MAEKDDEEFLWKMLYYAAHMDEDGETSLQAARHNPDLIKYAKGWGRETDLGCIALERGSRQPVGAAWVRLLIGEEKTFSYIDDATPELAIAVLPSAIGQGIGTQLLTHLLTAASKRYPAIVLSVRATNPARHLYSRMGFVLVGEGTNRVGTASTTMIFRFEHFITASTVM